MSLSTLIPAAGDFDRWETELTQPIGEPQPEPDPSPLAGVPAARGYNVDDMLAGRPVRVHRPSRQVADKRAIEQSMRGEA